jgi:hypothetical protein
MSIVLAKNCIEKTQELNVSPSFFKGRLLSRAMSVIVVPTEFVALVGKVVRFVFIDSVGKFCLLALQYCDNKDNRFKDLDDKLNPKRTARKIVALSIGLPSSILFSWSVPNLNYTIHKNFGLTTISRPSVSTSNLGGETYCGAVKIAIKISEQDEGSPVSSRAGESDREGSASMTSSLDSAERSHPPATPFSQPVQRRLDLGSEDSPGTPVAAQQMVGINTDGEDDEDWESGDLLETS